MLKCLDFLLNIAFNTLSQNPYVGIHIHIHVHTHIHTHTHIYSLSFNITKKIHDQLLQKKGLPDDILRQISEPLNISSSHFTKKIFKAEEDKVLHTPNLSSNKPSPATNR